MNKPLLASDYTYDLSEERIALHPSTEREQSRLIFYDKGSILDKQFHQLPELLPPDSILYFNDTKVIHARFLFKKSSGATIEILLLNPVLPSTMLSDGLAAVRQSTWKCVVGNLKRWKDGILEMARNQFTVNALLLDRRQGLVKFSWTPAETPFTTIIENLGIIPLPPYINRESEEEDRQRYQTVYSQIEGAVAAPTAGLHFTKAIFQKITERQIDIDFLTLHVSAGTFLPMTVSLIQDHRIHEEQIIIRKSTILNLLKPNKFHLAVGTTSLRTLESIYWYGVQLLRDPQSPFLIRQEMPYETDQSLPVSEAAVRAVLSRFEHLGVEEIKGSTSLFIYPGYTFRICRGLITNFHQPGSTLLLLVAAFVGKDWKMIYQAALDSGYRFLSYGDSSLLLPNNKS